MPSSPGSSAVVRNWTKRDWARYQAFKRRIYMMRRRLVDMYQQYGDLYSHGWETAETWFIREECEEIGLPMGYGRVGRTPEPLSWGIATAPDHRVDWSGHELGVDSEDEEA